MIYPATYNIAVLQDSTWKAGLRLTETPRSVEIHTSDSLFVSHCHGLVSNDPVIFNAKTTEQVKSISPCEPKINKAYYVLAAGLTEDLFAVSEVVGGSAITLSGAQPEGLTFARPINLTGATVDADIKISASGSLVKTFTCTIVSPLLGEVEMLLSSVDTISLEARSYNYDLSVTTATGEKYYWLTGKVKVQKTYSRD